MKMSDTIKLLEKYTTCPECGNHMIGNGKGGLRIEETTFDRWCKCGWKVHVESSEMEAEKNGANES